MNANIRLFVCTIYLIENRDSQHVFTCIYQHIADEINISITMTLAYVYLVLNKQKKRQAKSVH